MKRIFLIPILSVVCLSVGAQVSQEEYHGFVEYPDVAYYTPGEQADNTKLTIIMPINIANPPVLMWIGGGAWAYVDRNKELKLCRRIAKHGIAVISVGHRLSPALLTSQKRFEGVSHPEHVKDIAKAFRWVYDHAQDYGFDPNNIFVGGYSSGAHLSALLAMDGKYLEMEGLSTSDIRGIIPVAGGYDIPHYRESLMAEDSSYLENHINPVFGSTQEAQIDASPITIIDSLHSPILLISEGETYEYSILLEKKLVEMGYKDFSALNAHSETHASLWLNLSNAEQSIYRDYIAGFIKNTSR